MPVCLPAHHLSLRRPILPVTIRRGTYPLLVSSSTSDRDRPVLRCLRGKGGGTWLQPYPALPTPNPNRRARWTSIPTRDILSRGVGKADTADCLQRSLRCALWG
uniref:Uncharacterized protein n=1 Tax=Knipowitschia caucasica TaxID=637954 RepID=A0AAV2K3M1_KNICA